MLDAGIHVIAPDATGNPRSLTLPNTQISVQAGGGYNGPQAVGPQTPTFTVYKLERPSRVVVDVPQARLGEALRGHESAALLSANTWAVSTIAAQQLEDGGSLVRLSITLARPGRYEVKPDGTVSVVSEVGPAVPDEAWPDAAGAAVRPETGIAGVATAGPVCPVEKVPAGGCSVCVVMRDRPARGARGGPRGWASGEGR